MIQLLTPLTCIRKMMLNLHLSRYNSFFKKHSLAWIIVVFFSMYSYAEFMEIQLGKYDLLSKKVTSEIENVDSLKISGHIHSEDISFIQNNLSHTETKKAKLSYLDLSKVDAYVSNGGIMNWHTTTYLPSAFGNDLTVSVLKLPKLHISYGSFNNNPYLTSLELAPDTEIEESCFCNCDSLESIYIPKGCVITNSISDVANTCFLGKRFKVFEVSPDNNFYKSEEGLLLDNEGKTLIAVPMGLKKVKVPDIVEIISKNAFGSEKTNQNIETIQFGKNLMTIEDCPFNNKPRLARIIIQSALVGDIPKCQSSHFYSGYFFDRGELYVPIGTRRYFENTTGWSKIPKIIEYSSEELRQIYEDEAYDETYGYDYDFKVDGIYYKITSFEDGTVGVVNGNISYTGSVDIPEKVMYRNNTLTVTSIISMNGNIAELTIPNSIESIQDLSGNEFETIRLPKELKEFGYGVFSNCKFLKTIDIPDDISEIPECAFKNCSSLETVNWRPQKYAQISPEAFFECVSLNSFTFTDNIHYTGTIDTSHGSTSSFYNCPLDSLIFEDDCSITLGYTSDGVKYSPLYCEFEGNKVRKIYLGHLYWCKSGPSFPKLEELIIGDKIERVIYDMSNYGYRYPSLNGLKNLTIGSRCSKIEPFSSQNIWVRNPIPPNINGSLSNDVYLNSKLYVPIGSIDAYQNAPIWKNFWNIEEFDCGNSSFNQVTVVNKCPVGIYDLNGTKHEMLINGLNIIHYSDGTVEKIFK